MAAHSSNAGPAPFSRMLLAARLAMVLALLSGCNTAPTKQEVQEQFRADALAIWNAPEMTALRGKTALWDNEITPSMTLDPAVPTDNERKAMLFWIDRLYVINGNYRTAFAKLYPLEASAGGMTAIQNYHDREIQLGRDLYEMQLTWGRYNTLRQENDRRFRADINVLQGNLLNALGAAAAALPLPSSSSSPNPYLLPPPEPPRFPVTCRQVGPWVTCW